MPLFIGENVYPIFAQFVPLGSATAPPGVPLNAKEGAMWYDNNAKAFKGLINGVAASVGGTAANVVITNASGTQTIQATGATTTLNVSSTGAQTALNVFPGTDVSTAFTVKNAAQTVTSLQVDTTSGGNAVTINQNAGNGLIVNGNSTFNNSLAITLLRAVNNSAIFYSQTPPTISSGFGTSPSVVHTNGSASIQINVGTGGTATSGVIGMPAVNNGWACSVNNQTAAAGNRADSTVQTASTTTTVSVQNQTKSTGAAVAWTASDILVLSCWGY